MRFLGDYLAKVIHVVQAQRDDLAALEAPSKDSETADELVTRWDGVLASLRRIRESADNGDDAGVVQGIKSVAGAKQSASDLARRLTALRCTTFGPFGRTP